MQPLALSRFFFFTFFSLGLCLPNPAPHPEFETGLNTLDKRGVDGDCLEREYPSGTKIMRDSVEIIELLSWGGFGAVYSGTLLSNGRKVAVKIMRNLGSTKPFCGLSVGTPQLEIGWTKAVKSVFDADKAGEKKLPAYEDYFVEYVDDGVDLVKERTMLVLEYCVVGDLPAFLDEMDDVNERVEYVYEAILSLTEAVGALHSAGIAHRDIKPENIMVTKGPDGQPRYKLHDFGMMTRRPTFRSYMGTRIYMAPEVWAEVATGHNPPQVDFNSFAADLYAVGASAATLATDEDQWLSAHANQIFLPVTLEKVLHYTQNYHESNPALKMLNFRDQDVQNTLRTLMTPDPSQRNLESFKTWWKYLMQKRGLPV